MADVLAPEGGDWDYVARKELLPAAAAAPSLLNSQPWRVRLPASLRAEIFLDPHRLLPKLDPTCREAVISIGAFIENLDLASRHAGFNPDITYFPSGWPEPRFDMEAPVARFDLKPEGFPREDPLFRYLYSRRTNRRSYKRSEIPQDCFGTLAGSFQPEPAPISLGYTAHAGLKAEIAGHLVDAMEVETADTQRLRETASWMRDPSRNGRGLSIGIPFRLLGMSVLSAWYIRLEMALRDRLGKDEILRRTLMSLARKQVRSAAAFGWIATKENHRIGQLRAGRAYERVHLSAASTGLSLQPMNQVIRDYEDMREIRKEFQVLLGIPETHTIQMFFRLGYAGPSPPSPRLSPGDFMVETTPQTPGSGGSPQRQK
jgi:hypothetical protein